MQDESKIRQSSYTEGLIHPSCQAVNEGRRQKWGPGALPDWPLHLTRPGGADALRTFQRTRAELSRSGAVWRGVVLPECGWSRGEPERKNKGVQLQGAFIYCPVCFNVAVRGVLPPGVAVFWLALKRSRSVLSSSPEVPRCCQSLPAVPGLSGLRCLFIKATTPYAGSVLWARTNLCFHNGGIKRSLGLLLEHQPVNPGGGQFFPCLLVLPSRRAAALSCLSVR